MNLAANHTGVDLGRLAAFAAGLHGLGREDVQLEVRALRGGLQASGISRVVTRAAGAPNARARFVVKRVAGGRRREADAYRSLGEHGGAWLAPHLLGLEQIDQDQSYLYLEEVVAWRRWPWRDVAVAGQVLERLAWVHTNLPPRPPFANPQHETDLVESAAATLETFEEAVRHPHLAPLARAGRHLRRVVERLPEIRRALLSHGTAVLHGDVHPGNVLVRRRGGRLETVLIDWADMRVGTPLEDVASWLQSLAYWEPQARRRHDTLLTWYLGARGFAPHLSRELRRRYWLAAACNALRGALRYHLWIAQTTHEDPKRRGAGAAAARDWLRIVRRADQCFGP